MDSTSKLKKSSEGKGKWMFPTLYLTGFTYFSLSHILWKRLRNIFDAWVNKRGWQATLRWGWGWREEVAQYCWLLKFNILDLENVMNFFLFLSLVIWEGIKGLPIHCICLRQFFHSTTRFLISLKTQADFFSLLPWLNINVENTFIQISAKWGKTDHRLRNFMLIFGKNIVFFIVVSWVNAKFLEG